MVNMENCLYVYICILDECRALWGEPEQPVCQRQLRMWSLYTRMPSCRGVEVSMVFSEGSGKVPGES